MALAFNLISGAEVFNSQSFSTSSFSVTAFLFDVVASGGVYSVIGGNATRKFSGSKKSEVEYHGGAGERKPNYDYLGPKKQKIAQEIAEPKVRTIIAKTAKIIAKSGESESDAVDKLIEQLERNNVLWKEFYAKLLNDQLEKQRHAIHLAHIRNIEMDMQDEEEILLLFA